MAYSKLDKELIARIERLERHAGFHKPDETKIDLTIPKPFEYEGSQFTFTKPRFRLNGVDYLASDVANAPEEYRDVLTKMAQMETKTLIVKPLIEQ